MNMTHGWLSIALTCAFGALIGTLTALEISARFEYGSYLWSVGALVGGIAAYVAIDFRHFCAGVAHSYHRTIAWRPDLLWWKAFAMMSGGTAMIYLSIIGIVGAVVVYFSDEPMQVAIGMLWLALVISVISVGISWLAVDSSSSNAKDVTDREQWLRNLAEGGRKAILYFNPIGATLATFRGLKWIAVRTPSAITRAVPATIDGVYCIWNIVKQFVARAFICVHSQRRIICFIDATLGAAVGYFFGSAVIGTIMGGLLGAINYEIVSVRWLRIVPTSR